MPENTKTGLQSTQWPIGYWTTSDVMPKMPVSFAYYRRMRLHPTISLARKLSTAPLLRADWSLEGEDATDETMLLAQEVIDSLRGPYMAHALRSLYDFGWCAFEQYFSEGTAELNIKPLLNDFVRARVTPSGDFAGVSVRGFVNYGPVILPADQVIWLGLDSEAQNPYGTSNLEIARSTYAAWREVDGGAARYDAKVAGTFLVLHYPEGTSLDANGTETDNGTLAQSLLETFESSGMVAIADRKPGLLDEVNGELPSPEWHFEFLSDSSPRQAAFIERSRYLDALMVRAFGLPERAILEGEFGTKAEAMAHQNLALQAMEATHEFLTQEFDRQALQPYLRLVLGSEAAGTVRLNPGPINRETTLWKRSLVEQIVAKRAEVVDLDALMDEVGLAKAEEIVEAAPTEEAPPVAKPAEEEEQETANV